VSEKSRHPFLIYHSLYLDIQIDKMNASDIINPTLLLDEVQAKYNIRMQIGRCKEHGISFRPHFKTHQSKEVANWYRELGVDKIAVSSIQMAAYFAEDGWKDIAIAFPVNVLEIETINRLAASTQLTLLISDLSVLDTLERKLNSKTNVFLEIETGQKRSGLPIENTTQIINAISAIQGQTKLKFSGFLIHSGESYSATPESMGDLHQTVSTKIREFRHAMLQQLDDVFISFGDTPLFSSGLRIHDINEWRPGNAVFYDLMQHQIGACSLDQIAVTMACPVVANYPERKELIIYGGAVHFSKDKLDHPELGVCYGIAKEILNPKIELGFGEMIIASLSQEHGIVRYCNDEYKNIRPGSVISFLSRSFVPHD
jgi:D-serine deaminase-like pyridoxal phosphate-dependent protein